MIQYKAAGFPLVDVNPQTFTNIPTANENDFQKPQIKYITMRRIHPQ